MKYYLCQIELIFCRTIYVPYDSAVNVPEIFDVNVGSSFGYSEPQQQQQPSYSFNPGSSAYDNPISSFDAPIYDENSYTAAAVRWKLKLKWDTKARYLILFLIFRVLMTPIHSVTRCIEKMLAHLCAKWENLQLSMIASMTPLLLSSRRLF